MSKSDSAWRANKPSGPGRLQPEELEEFKHLFPGLLDDESDAGDGSDASSGDAADQPLQETFAEDVIAPPEKADGDRTFDPIDLRDRVVIKLIFEELVEVELVEKAWNQWLREVESGSQVALWRVLASNPDIDDDLVYSQAADVYSFDQVDVSAVDVSSILRGAGSRLTHEQWNDLRQLSVVVVGLKKGSKGEGPKLVLATHDPSRSDLAERLRQIGIQQYELRFGLPSEIRAYHDDVRRKNKGEFGKAAKDIVAVDLGTSVDERKQLLDEDALEAEVKSSALIGLFEATLVEGVREGASDIHIFPNARRQIEIHFRIDGELSSWHVEDRVHPEAFLAIIKDNSMNVDRFERDTAQDGFIQRDVDGATIRFRVSVLPIANAELSVRSESIVIRILDDRKVVRDLAKLGISDEARERFEWAIHQPYGMVILTGPTGSGKSTTLYAAMTSVVTPKVNALTVEDPVEYIIPEVRQIKLSHKLNLEFALRSILRHDPDIVMVGEMRDRPTAELAIKLANTGHLTFSTLHTNDAPSSVSRLYKMGVEPFLIAYAINLIVAQRLIRFLCPDCKTEDSEVTDRTLAHFGFSEGLSGQTIYKATSSPKCKTCRGVGYKGRRAITETMPFTPEVRDLIVSSEGMIEEEGLRKLAVSQGMRTLQDRARDMVLAGDTSIQEMMRVVFTGLA
jgi:type IV pilus assembly protein PilB